MMRKAWAMTGEVVRPEGLRFLSGIIIVSAEPERLVAFYRDILGVPLVEESHGDTERHWGCELGDVHFAIHPEADYPGESTDTGAVKLAFMVFDLDGLVAWLGKHGVELDYPPTEFGTQSRITAVRDPDGNLVELTSLGPSWLDHLRTHRANGGDLVAHWTNRSRGETGTFVRSGPLTLWTERFGDPTHPAILLIMGAAAQGITCPDALVDRLVGHGFQVLRFDHRDTGRSSTVNFDEQPYAIADMAADCLAVLDGYGIEAAHLVGASLGGILAQWLAIHAPDRVARLTLLGTTTMGESYLRLPPPAPHYQAFVESQRDVPPGPEADVELFRVMNGDVLPYDEAGARAMLERAWTRATDPAAARNHHRAAGGDLTPDLLAPLSGITAPTTILHGDQDPIFSLAHAEALAAEIPHAHYEVVRGMGHVLFSPGLPERVADLIAQAAL
jgi:pimeloyl-ACP methyl ester carboxylesterase/catechol 2,3-dioxygenase-like lactoylglutathione lyase family enzyme